METPHHSGIYLLLQVILIQILVCVANNYIFTSKIDTPPPSLHTCPSYVISNASINFFTGLLKDWKK